MNVSEISFDDFETYEDSSKESIYLILVPFLDEEKIFYLDTSCLPRPKPKLHMVEYLDLNQMFVVANFGVITGKQAYEKLRKTGYYLEWEDCHSSFMDLINTTETIHKRN